MALLQTLVRKLTILQVGGKSFCVPQLKFLKDSPYFKEILLDPDGEDTEETPTVTIKDVTADQFETFLRVLYPS